MYKTSNYPLYRMPSKLEANFAMFAKGWNRIIYNDSQCLDFLHTHFQPQVAPIDDATLTLQQCDVTTLLLPRFILLVCDD
jgi:hypothetical protein